NIINIVPRGVREIIPDTFPTLIRTLIERCWLKNPQERISFSELIFELNSFGDEKKMENSKFPEELYHKPWIQDIKHLWTKDNKEIPDLQQLQKVFERVKRDALKSM